MRVLLVEDSDFTRSTVAAALRVENLVVAASVSSAGEAMMAAEEHHFDCAVVDLNLGHGPSGMDVAYGLRKRDPDIGIVLLTSFADPRLLSADDRPLPSGGIYAVKSEIRTTAHLGRLVAQAMDAAPSRARGGQGQVHLSNTQMDVLRLVAAGLTNTEIARRRVVSERSVQTAIGRILRSLHIDPAPGENPRVLLVQRYNEMTGACGS